MTQVIQRMKDKEEVTIDVLIVSCEAKKTTTNKDFLQISARSQIGETISMKKWSSANPDELRQNFVYKITGSINEYNGAKSVNIKSVSDSDLERENFNDCPLTPNQLNHEFNKIINSFKNPNIKTLVIKTLSKVQNYFEAPAAKNIHHEFKGGLAYHSITMAKSGALLSKLYPQLNRDLLVASALLHDAGKTIEINMNNEYTTQGHLFGHIVIINDLITEVLVENPELKEDNDIALIKHIILSHHGKLEWGSPVQGMIPEAVIFHYIDKIDADMQVMEKNLKFLDGNSFTPRVWALESRFLYQPGDTQILSNDYNDNHSSNIDFEL